MGLGGLSHAVIGVGGIWQNKHARTHTQTADQLTLRWTGERGNRWESEVTEEEEEEEE